MNFTEITLKTNSIHKTRLFYHKTLELPVISEAGEKISFKAGNTILSFEAVTDGKPYYHIAFNITNNKFSESFEWIDRKLDIIPASEQLPIAIYTNWNAESFYFYDPNHNILEFIVRFDLPYHSPEPFSVADIKEISEVGIATDNVAATAKELSEKYKIPYFAKSAKQDDFQVLGDDKGLFIISQKGRAWVPTNKPALPFPISIKAEGGIDIVLH